MHFTEMDTDQMELYLPLWVGLEQDKDLECQMAWSAGEHWWG